MSVARFLCKYALSLFHVMSLIAVTGIVSVGFVVDQMIYKWSDFVDLPKIVLVVGLGLFVFTCFVGMCGVLADNGFILTTFHVLLTIVLIGELVLSCLVYYERAEIKTYALTRLNDTIFTYNETARRETSTRNWDSIQSYMECCGIHGPKDWKPIMPDNNLPKTCCSELSWANGSCTAVNSYKNGCFDKLESTLKDNSQSIVWTAFGFGSVQLFAVFLVLYLRFTVPRDVENDDDDFEYHHQSKSHLLSSF